MRAVQNLWRWVNVCRSCLRSNLWHISRPHSVAGSNIALTGNADGRRGCHLERMRILQIATSGLVMDAIVRIDKNTGWLDSCCVARSRMCSCWRPWVWATSVEWSSVTASHLLVEVGTWRRSSCVIVFSPSCNGSSRVDGTAFILCTFLSLNTRLRTSSANVYIFASVGARQQDY